MPNGTSARGFDVLYMKVGVDEQRDYAAVQAVRAAVGGRAAAAD